MTTTNYQSWAAPNSGTGEATPDVNVNNYNSYNYTEQLNFEDAERQWINDQINFGLAQNAGRNEEPDISANPSYEELVSSQETSDRDLTERLIRLKQRELDEALTKQNEELTGLNLEAVSTETQVSEAEIQKKLDQGFTLEEATSGTQSAEGSRAAGAAEPRTVINTSETAESQISSDLGDIDLTVTNDFQTEALPPQPEKPNLELLKIKGDEAPYKVSQDTEDVSTVSGTLSFTEPDLTLPGRNGHRFTLTRSYDSGASQLYEADVKENVSSVPIYNINTNYQVDVYGNVYYLNYNYHVLNVKYKCSDNSFVLQESEWFDPSTPTQRSFSSESERASFYNSLVQYKEEAGPSYCSTDDRYYLHKYYLIPAFTSAYQYLRTESYREPDGPYLLSDAQNAVAIFNNKKGSQAFSESDANYNRYYKYDYASLITTPIDTFDQVSYSNSIVDSKDQKRAPLGIGWSWNIPYVTFDNGTYIHLADGGSYQVEAGVLKGYPWKDLTLASDTSVTVNGLKSAQVLRNSITGEKQYFDDKGKVLQISDAYNNNTSFQYADVSPYGTLLTQITDAIGNQITIQYTSSAVTLTMGDRQVIYKKTIQNGKELLTQVIDPLNRKTTYDYSIATAKFDLLSTTPTTLNPYALITGVTYPTGAKSVYEYEATPVKRYTSASSVNEAYRLAVRKDVVTYSDQTTSDANRMAFIYPTDMGNSYNVDMNFTTKTIRGQIETLYTYKKDFIDNQTPPMIYNTNIEASDLAIKQITNNTFDEARRIPSPISTTSYYRSTSAQSEPIMDSKTFDDYGNILTRTNALNKTTTFTYDPTTHFKLTETWPVSATDSLFVDMIRNAQGDVLDYKLKLNNAAGAVLQRSTYDYDGFGNVVATTDFDTARQALTTYEYDPAYGSAYLTKETALYKDADGVQQSSSTSSTYDKLSGNMLTYTDGRSNKTSYQYDKLDRLTKVTNPNTSWNSLVYDDTNNQVTQTDEAGVQTRITWDGLGRQIKSEIYEKEPTDAAPSFKAKSKTGYDALSRKAWDEDASGDRTAYTYDNWDRLIKTTNADLSFSQVVYDDILHTITEVDEENNPVKKQLDHLDRVTSEQELENGTYVTKRSTQYDDADNITQISTFDAPGVENVTKYSYDVLDELRSVTTPKNELFTYAYDQLGNSTGVTYPDNKKLIKEYDEVGNLIKYTDEAGKQKKMYYDAEGNLSKLIDRNNKTFTYQYDTQNRLQYRYGPSETISYVYNPDGKRKTMADKTGTTQYDYDSYTGLLKSKTYPDGKTVQYTYDLRGNRTGLTDPFGRAIAYSYDTVNRISTVKTDNQLSATYAYYRNDNVKTITHANNFTSNYVYDGLDLKSLQHKKADGTVVNSFDYESDWSSNVTKRTENGTINNYTYDKLGQMLTNTQFHETYGYDARGNRTSLISDATPSIDNFNYTYDEWNQLTKVTDKDAATISYTYNGDGLLYERTAGGTKTRYYWDDQLLIGEATVNGTTVTPKASYVYGNGLLERIDGNNLTKATYLLNGHNDVVELRDNAGTVLNKYTYDIWGKPLSVSETIDNPFWYSSEYWDKNSGLQYLRSRWYNPESARFTSEDTFEGELKNPLSLNLYTYVMNSPLRYTDPSGHKQHMLDYGGGGDEYYRPAVSQAGGGSGGSGAGARSLPQSASRGSAGTKINVNSSKSGSKVPSQLTRGQKFEKDVLKENNLNKNGGKGTTEKIGKSIPDSVSNGRITEVKDQKYIYNNSQMRDYAKDGRPIDLYVSPKTKVSKNAQATVRNSGGSIIVRKGTNSYAAY
ncbi:RHS repeat-associated core domain-containing protein [Paenibacillus sp. UNC496MF]|uniref:RHS repeat-associated core domain-containing protein n=1 Tax=Paenibacillus sp. UNC496MF TaxID=1502753 RepID=UPI001C433437|nr:RHS repeat-associated core domain-containing protein [Paenibacillus sp. UNC496MF]